MAPVRGTPRLGHLVGSVSGRESSEATRYQAGAFGTIGNVQAASQYHPCGSFYLGQTGSTRAVSVNG